jgi:hypothetical protein
MRYLIFLEYTVVDGTWYLVPGILFMVCTMYYVDVTLSVYHCADATSTVASWSTDILNLFTVLSSLKWFGTMVWPHFAGHRMSKYSPTFCHTNVLFPNTFKVLVGAYGFA